MSGVPLSEDGAQELFDKDPRQFQHWAVELTGGFCSAKHSGDRGIDGRIYFDTSEGLKSMVLSVKGGGLSPAYVRELRGTLERPRHAASAPAHCDDSWVVDGSATRSRLGLKPVGLTMGSHHCTFRMRRCTRWLHLAPPANEGHAG